LDRVSTLKNEVLISAENVHAEKKNKIIHPEEISSIL